MRGKAFSHLLAFVAVAAVSVIATQRAIAQGTLVSVTGTTYSQNFDGMGNAAGGSVPTGWGFFRSGAATPTPAFTSGSTTLVTTQAAGSAVGTAPTAGGAYLWVTGTLASGTDKSIGFLSASAYPGPASGSTTSSLALLFGFTNNAGGTITNLDITWDYEKYRSGSRAFDWNFFTSTDGSTWTANASGNQSYLADANNTTMINPPSTTAKSVSVSGLNIAAGGTYYLRWSYVGNAGWSNGQGLSVDNFVMNATVTGGASNSYWDGGTGWTATAPGAGGNGTWADGTGGWTSANIANFGGTAGTVTTGSVTAGSGIVFTTSGYTLSGGTVALTATSIGLNAITTGSTTPFTTTIDSVLSGTSGLTKLGAGTLVLNGANTFSGNLAASAGTVQIATDSALGDAANDIALGGTLATTASIVLGAGRDMTGSGTLDIAPGTTLTSSGSFNLTSTTLSNGGTLDLQGATRSIGLLTFGTAATVNGSGAISSTGITATGVTSGTAVVNPAITFSSGDKNVSVGSGGTLLLNGDIAGTAGRIATSGGGTLVVAGSNAATGFNIGTAGSTPVNGGTVVLGQASSSGTGQTFFNYGAIEAAVPMTVAAGLSIGGRPGALTVIGGTNPITFSGSSRFFASFGATGPCRLDVNNSTTFAGVFGPTSGTSSLSAVTIGGSGTLSFNGSAAGFVDTITLQDTVDLMVNETLGGGVNVGAATLLGGTGTISGAVQVADSGYLAPGPGSSPGTLTINNVLTGTSLSIFAFDLSATDQTVGGGVNDLVTGVTNLTLDGALFVNGIGDFTTVAAGTMWRLFNYSGTLTDLSLGFGLMPTLAAGQSFAIDTSTPGQVNLMVVPEPGAVALAGFGGLLAAGWAAKRRRRLA